MRRSNMRIYDNKGRSFDRYTVLFMDNQESKGLYYGLGMSEHPFAPNGFGQHINGVPDRHLGVRIDFDTLPTDCQTMVNNEFGLSLEEFKHELRLNDVKGEPWDVCMGAFFDLASVAYERNL